MTYAFVVNEVIEEEFSLLPDSARRLDTQEWVMGLSTAPVNLVEATGWFTVLNVARPPDTPTLTSDRSLILVNGDPTEVWTSRPWTPEELASNEAQTNTAQMIDESDESVDKLVLVIEALNAITALTNADINANPAAILKDLTRECKTIARQANREARLTSGRTESTDTGPVIDA